MGASLALVLALLAVGCGGTANSAAIVNGHPITQSTLDGELHAILANAAYVAAIEQSGQPVHGKGKGGTFDLAFADKVLTREILLKLLHDEVVRRKLTISPADLSAAAGSQRSQIGNDPQTGKPLFDGFSPAYQQLLTRRAAEITALQDVLGNVKTDAASVQRYYTANVAKYMLSCVSHILVKDKPTADAIRAQIVAGGPGNDFAALAKKNSTDTQSATNGGDLGCQPPGTYVAPFEQAVATLTVGQLSQPVQTQFGWHLIKVTDRKVQALADVKSQIVQTLQSQGQAQLSQFIQDAVTKAKVTVNPRYGTFQTSGPQPGVVPPVAPSVGGVTPTTSAPPGTSGQGAGAGQTGSGQPVPTSTP